MVELSALQLTLQDHLKKNGLKKTRQRDVILTTLWDADKHITIDELLELAQEQIPGIGYATVYRSLKLFVRVGIVAERRFGEGQTQYEIVHDEHHDHIICTECGHIIEFEDELIERRQNEIAIQYGIEILSHRHEIFGRCLDIAKCEQLKSAK